MYCADARVVVVGALFRFNRAPRAGAVYAERTALDVRDTVFRENLGSFPEKPSWVNCAGP